MVRSHSAHPPPLSAGGVGGGVNILPNFQKWGARQDLRFLRMVAEKEGATFFRGGCNFLTKNKLKSGMFNDKKKFINKNALLCRNQKPKIGNFYLEFSYF